jgi:hypothetical protein
MTLTTRRLVIEVMRGSHVYLKIGTWEYFRELGGAA